MDKLDEIAFKKGLRRIDEKGVNRILSHGKYGFVIVSSNRSEIYSDDKNNDLTDEYLNWCKVNNFKPDEKEKQKLFLTKRNKNADSELANDLRQSPYAFTPVYGGYHGQDDISDSFEPSFIVYNHSKNDSKAYLNWNDLLKFAISLCQKYKQDSVYVQAPNEPPVYIGQDGSVKSSSSTTNFKINDYDQEFFTTTDRQGRKGSNVNGFETKPKRFTADINFESCYRKSGPSTYFERMKRRKLGEVFLDD